MPTELNEGLLTANRIAELFEDPVAGRFDAAHLREVHRRIFQDLPHHAPGDFRPDAPGHMKSRALESSRLRYPVAYALRPEVDARLDGVLDALDGGKALRGLSVADFSARMSRLYGDLDHLHPFREGNSRTLRSFTVEIAREAGHTLDWGTTNANAVTRDNLYMARDFAVIQRTYPGIAAKDPAAIGDRDEFAAYLALGEVQRADRLSEIIRQSADRGRVRPEGPVPLSELARELDTLLPAARHQAGADEERARVAALRKPALQPLHDEAVKRRAWIEGRENPSAMLARADAARLLAADVRFTPGERAIDRVLAIGTGLAAAERARVAGRDAPVPSRPTRDRER